MDLDTSWIDNYQKISSIQENYFREPMTSIPLFFIYMNQNDEIIKVMCEEEVLESSTIFTERLLRIIEDKRHINHSTYKLVDLLQYVVDIEPENLQSFIAEEGGSQWLKSISYSIGDIKIPHSIFIFHELNHLYFFFRISEKSEGKEPLRSILKGGIENNGHLRVTKKVRIVDIPIEEKKKFKEYLRKSFKKKKSDKSKTRKSVT